MSRRKNRRTVDLFILVAAWILLLSTEASASNKSARIAVIGAGPAGLTAALTLADLGYSDVTVYEANSTVGGKAHSVEVDGRAYDLGAAFVLPDYKVIREIAERFHVPYEDSGMRHTVLDSSGYLRDMREFPLISAGADALLQSMLRYRIYRFLNPNSVADDFARAPTNLNEPFVTFAARHGIEPLALGAAPMIVGCGYGYYEEVPALYVMRLMESFIPLFRTAMISPRLMPFPNFVARFKYGYQSLWTAMARHLNVRLNSPVQKVTRSMDSDGDLKIRLTAGDRTAEFDRVVIASPLDKALGFLDASSEERNLFSRIRYYTYTVTLFRAAQLETPAITFIDAQTKPETIGRITGLYNQYADGNIWTAGQLGTEETGGGEMARILHEDIAATGGVVGEIIAQRRWQHFPHVKTKDLNDGFYQRLENLQGVSGTYYIGGIMNLDSVEHTARFARNLILSNF